MIYTQLGARGPRVSRLGFGCMRLPSGPDGNPLRDESVSLLRQAFEWGVTYFDTAVGYCAGQSQPILGEAVAPFRDRVVLSTKNPFHDAPPDRWRRALEDSLRLLRTDRIDLYHLHSLNWDAFERHVAPPGGKLDELRKARDKGLIRHICCSVHDSAEALRRIAATGAFDVITLQYNLLNRDYEEVMHDIAARGIGIVVMGPVGGGRLGVNTDRIVALTGGAVQSTPEAALRFVLAHPAVSLALSGMSTREQLAENVRIVSEKPPFTPAQIAALDAELRDARARLGVNCPGCGYCMPCPRGVAIPDVFRRFNELRAMGLTAAARRGYAGLAEVAGADRCSQCGACLPKCPQRIEIPKMLQRALADLDPACAGVTATLAPVGTRGGGLRVECRVRNNSPAAAAVRVQVRLPGGPKGPPRPLEFDAIPPWGAAARRFDWQPPEGAARIEGECEIESGGAVTRASQRAPFFLVPRERSRVHTITGDPALFGGDAAAVAACALEVRLSHDGERIEAVIRAKAPPMSPAAPGSEKGTRLVIAADGRPSRHAAPDTLGAGIARIVLRPSETDVRAAPETAEGIEADYRALPDGGEWRLRLPLAGWRGRRHGPPSEIGLEIALILVNDGGQERGRIAFSGRRHGDRHPRQFPPAFLLR